MGQFLSLLSSSNYEEVELSFNDNPKPTSDEEKTFERVAAVLAEAPNQMKMITDYAGCQDLARKAMTDPTAANEKAAFNGLLGAVDSIAAFFNYTKQLDSVFPELLLALANAKEANEATKTANIPDALALQLSQMFEFCVEFDRLRMLRPNLSNDFSYYRRLLSKFNRHPDFRDTIRIRDDEASGMALFTAEHIPMMNCLAKSAARAQEKNPHVGSVLAILANSCLKALKTKKFDEATNYTCARAMTASIVVFDHINPTGVFTKKSPVQVKACITLLKKDYTSDLALLNAIRFSTKTFNSAPQGIQDMFD